MLNYCKDVIYIITHVCNYEFSNHIVNCNLSFKSSRHMKNNHFINIYNFTNVHNLQKENHLVIQDWRNNLFSHCLTLNVHKY
jgi:hypothetical protein